MVNFFECFNNRQKQDAISCWDGNKENFEIWFIAGKISHYCSLLSSCLSIELNKCGWLFNRYDYNHKLYIDYQKYEEFSRLLNNLKNKINKLQTDAIDYDTLCSIEYEVSEFANHFFCRCDEYRFINSDMELGKLKKSINKCENTLNKIINTRKKNLEIDDFDFPSQSKILCVSKQFAAALNKAYEKNKNLFYEK